MAVVISSQLTRIMASNTKNYTRLEGGLVLLFFTSADTEGW